MGVVSQLLQSSGPLGMESLLAPYRKPGSQPLPTSLADISGFTFPEPPSPPSLTPGSPSMPVTDVGTVGSTVTGSTGSFNESHEGPGREGLSFGQQTQPYYGLAQALYKLIESRFPAVSMGGIFNARNIAGTSTPSEHAYGAALDTMVGTNALGDAVYRFLTRPKVANRFDYSNILWEVPNHYNHLHIGWLY